MSPRPNAVGCIGAIAGLLVVAVVVGLLAWGAISAWAGIAR